MQMNTPVNASRDIPVWAEPVARNPYRVLGLPGDSSWPDIRARVEWLSGKPDPEHETTAWDIPWFAPLPRGAGDIERAAARLADPVQRVRDRLFWFHERVSEMAVHELLPANLRNALEGWSATAEPLARHDAAVVALLKALAVDPRVEDAAGWRRLFHEWGSAIALEDYWMAVLRVEMGGEFEHPASLADVREVRETADQMVVAPLLEIARAAVLGEDLPVAARALAVLREALPEEAFSRTCGDLANHVWGRFDADWTTPAAAVERAAPESSGAVDLDTQNPGVWDMEDRPAAPRPAARAPDGDDRRVARASDAATPADIEMALGAEFAPPVEALAGPAETPSEPAEALAEPARDPSAPSIPAVREVDVREPAGGDVPDRRADDLAQAPPRRTPSGRTRIRLRPVWIGGIAASVAVAVTLVALEPGGSPPDSEEAPDPVTLTALENRLDRSFGDVAEVVAARGEVQREMALVEQAVEGYQILVDDYERRAAYRLAVDRAAWARVAATHDRYAARRDSLRQERDRLVAVQDSLERVDASLLAAYNLLLGSGTGSGSGPSSRAPSPR